VIGRKYLQEFKLDEDRNPLAKLSAVSLAGATGNFGE
jgi:hypothetical protein